jgi:hypothetical protein
MTRSHSSARDGHPSPSTGDPGAARGPHEPTEAELRREEKPGVPGFETWGGVYWFVFGSFVVVVLLLVAFSGAYA